jgi:hypothetical protein
MSLPRLSKGETTKEISDYLKNVIPKIAGGNWYFVDATAANQGVTGNGKTIKAYVDSIGANPGTIYFKHTTGTAATTYTLGTSLTIPSNIELIFERGAVISVSALVTLTNNGIAYVGATTISGNIHYFNNGAGTITYEPLSNLAVSQFTFSERARFYISMDANGDFANDGHAFALRVEAKYDYPSWTLGTGKTGMAIEMTLDNELNYTAHELGMCYGTCYALTADSKAAMHGIGADMVKQSPCTTSNTMIGHTSLFCSDVDPVLATDGCGFCAHCSPLSGYSAVRQYAAFLAEGTRGWKYSFLHYDTDQSTVLAWISQTGQFYSAEGYRAEATAPYFWLEEGTDKGCLITLLSQHLTFNRRTTAFGAQEAKPFSMSILAPDWSFSMKSAGNVAMGQETPDASALLHMVSTTKGFIPPSMTTTQRDAISTPAEGLVVYNVTTHKLNVRVVAAWEEVTSA